MEEEERRVCKVRTQDPEDLDEEVKSLVSAWRFNLICWFTSQISSSSSSLISSKEMNKKEEQENWNLKLMNSVVVQVSMPV